jgi:hypothetical protein
MSEEKTQVAVRDMAGNVLGHMLMPVDFYNRSNLFRFAKPVELTFHCSDDAQSEAVMSFVDLEAAKYATPSRTVVWCLRAGPEAAAGLPDLPEFRPIGGRAQG